MSLFSMLRQAVERLSGRHDVTRGAEGPINVALQVESMHQGGLEQVVFNLVRHLDPQRFSVTLLVCGDTPGYLGEMLASQGHDVVVLGRKTDLLEQVVRQRGIDLVNLHYSLWGVDTYRRLRIPMVYTIHNSYTWLSPPEVKARRACYRRMGSFIAVSNQVKGYFAARYGIDPAAIRTIPNGVDLQELAPGGATDRQRLGRTGDDFLFINISSFIPTKFQNIMVSAMKSLRADYPGARLLFVGNVLDPEYHAFITGRIREEGLGDRISISDFVGKEELAVLLSGADCFLLPSLQEGWSNAVMEAMSLGLPVILSDTGAARETAGDREFGIVIPNPYASILDLDCAAINTLAYDNSPRNLDALVAAMREVMTYREEWRERGKRGAQRVAESFSVRSMAAAYEQEFERTFERSR